MAEDGLEIAFTETFRVDFAGVDPNDHVRVRAQEHTDTCIAARMSAPQERVEILHAYRCKPGRRR